MEKWYQMIEKLALALVTSARGLRPYFQSHQVIVKTDYPIKQILRKPELAGRMIAWSVELSEFGIQYESRGALKAQCLADFVAELTPTSVEETQLEQSLKFGFKVTNNQAEYEPLLAGLRLAHDLGARKLNLIFHDLIGKFVQVYIDDIIVGSKQKEDHLCHLKSAFERMRKHGLKMNPLKCAFGVTAGEFLGFVIHQKGIEVDRNKTKAIMETKPLSNKKELQSLLGKVNFLRRFISNLSGKTKVFSPLLQYLAHPPMLAPLSKGKQLKLYISASDSTIAGMLAQDDDNGIERVIYYLIEWATMIKDCIEFAKSCEECQKHGPIQKVPASELHSIIKPWPFRGWAIDIIGQIHPPSSKNHKYILVAIDYLTKWVEPIPLKEVEQKDIIDFVEDHIITRFVIPQTITTDQGTLFTGRKVAQYAESRGIKLITSTPYYAQANGQVEAANKVVIGLIKKHISNRPRNWHETLVQILWAYRNSPRDATKTTPYKLVYGHDAILPLDINLQSIHMQKQNGFPIEDYWNLMYDELISSDEERLITLQNLVQQKEKVERSYNKRVKIQRFRVGDLVLKVILPIDQKSRYLGKWSYNWEGPFIVEQVYLKNTYIIKEINSNICKVMNGKYLKRFHNREE
uniref:Pro-Pol polyprotein n=1 Tax=Cajanus cajan TaxID=3821 RepID=A0A151T4I7_CAJCA|nr:Pro-Pol polyprotein [Cajanus cajan]